jgi:excisionase family DNA binding protein
MTQRSQRLPQQSDDRGSPLSLRPLLSVPEAAALLGIKTWTLRQWLSQRRIAFIKIGRLTKLRPEDITAFIQRNRCEAISFAPGSAATPAA